MTWSYDGSLSTSKDIVRFEIQDTDAADPLFSDEEIQATLLLKSNNPIATAAKLARTLALKFARFVNSSVKAVSESASDRYKAYQSLANDLEVRASSMCTPRFGGVLASKNDAAAADTDLVQPRETIGAVDDEHDTSTFGAGGGSGSVLPPS